MVLLKDEGREAKPFYVGKVVKNLNEGLSVCTRPGKRGRVDIAYVRNAVTFLSTIWFESQFFIRYRQGDRASDPVSWCGTDSLPLSSFTEIIGFRRVPLVLESLAALRHARNTH